ncbi:MAG TPA: PAS domain-containing protein, partial [Rubrobacteraceae bacterium]|nr:PAS domain-containing protein [Rubrobacteraceae bacterium]
MTKAKDQRDSNGLLGALLKDSELLRTLIDTLPDHLYIKDVEGRYVLSNIAHVKSLGFASSEEVAGKTGFDFYPMELAKRYHADEREVIRSGRPLVAKEEPSVKENGNRRWYSTTKAPLRDSGGKIVGIVGIARDITERKRAEEKLRESEERYRA